MNLWQIHCYGINYDYYPWSKNKSYESSRSPNQYISYLNAKADKANVDEKFGNNH